MNKPDLLYLSIKSEFEELKYSLRSIEKHGKNYGKVVIVGYCPRSLKPDLYIPHERSARLFKHRDIYEKMMTACEHDGLSENFVRMSDDYFLSAGLDFSTMPMWKQSDDLFTKSQKNPTNKINRCYYETFLALKDKGYSTENYQLHAPIPMEKTKFIEAANNFDWTKPFSLAARSIYGNYWAIDGIPKKDVKFSTKYTKKMINSVEMWSSGDRFWDSGVMEELYKNKSRWEK